MRYIILIHFNAFKIESFEVSQVCGDIILCLLSFGATFDNNTNLDGKTPLEMTSNQSVTTKVCNWLNLLKNPATSYLFADLKNYLTDPTSIKYYLNIYYYFSWIINQIVKVP